MAKILNSALFLSAYLLFSGCVAQQVVKQENTQESNDNWIPVFGIGANTSGSPEGLTVVAVDPGSPANKAGMQAGDVIVSVNGMQATQKDLFKLLQKAGDADIVLKAKRGEQAIEYALRPVRMMKWPPSADALNSLLMEEQPVKLAVYVAEVRSTVKGAAKSSEEEQRQQWHNFINNHVLKEFGKYKHFSMVNTVLVYNTLDRNRYEMSGPVPDDVRALLRRLTGATHLLVANLSRLQNERNRQVDIANARLIDLGTGKDVAFDQRIDCN